MKSDLNLYEDKKLETFASICRSLLIQVGEDPSRVGLIDTPERFAKSLRYLTSGYRSSTEEVLGRAIFPEAEDGIVLIKDIEFYSLCEHHILPFYGRAHVAYLPDKNIIGLSKVPRLVELYSRRLQVQERLTRQIAQALQESLKPRGVFVILEASHLCMMMRGVQKQQSKTMTQSHTGIFETDGKWRDEVRGLLGINA